MAGDTVLIAAGTYTENVTLKGNVDLEGAGEAVVVLVGTLITPATLNDVTVSKLTVESAAPSSLLLNLRNTNTLTDVVFSQVTFALTQDHENDQTPPIGNGDDGVSIGLVDGDGDGAGLTFSEVTLRSNGHTVTNPDGNVLSYMTVHGARLVLDNVDLSGTVSASGQGAQWNMETGGLPGALSLINSRTSGGGNFYVSAFTDVTIENNDFNGQGIALNGVENATVAGNTFRNIDGTFTANGDHHRGLTFENAWWGGGSAVSNVTVAGNTFSNISTPDGAIAFQRWTDGVGNPVNAGIDLLNDIDIHGNTFTNVEQPLFFNGSSFSAALIAAFAGADQLIIGTAGSDTLTDPAGGAAMIGGPGADIFAYAAGNGATVFVDFTPGTDRIALNGPIDLIVIASDLLFIATLLGMTTQVGANAVIDFGGGDTLTLSGVSKTSLTVDDFTFTAPNNYFRSRDDAYVILQGDMIAAQASDGVLANDNVSPPATATVQGTTAHGQLAVTADGAVSYTPSAGFSGIDSFTYHASGANGAGDSQALIYVVPVLAGAATTLNLVALSTEEQVAATYLAFLGRGSDADGFEFWVNELDVGKATQAPSVLLSNIANAFGMSAEAKALYSFLGNPFGASDSQIGAFLDSVYNNLFDRSSDAGGLAYWTGQIKQTLQGGQFVGSVLIDIMSGAQDTAAGKDITTLMSKVAVSLAYVHEQQEHGTAWSGANDSAVATILLDAVSADAQTVLAGIKNAEVIIASHV
ncbi:MAG: DUF4214 domain-containing protein [Reyranella sp.]|uniref:DUF4214 domain-containing protein n=1 Tax=Reyranella sp. TaxID=1929291 RepID=UPI003D09BB3B